MTMDVGQLTQMTTWLDEEHRRDKAEMIRLQQKIENQEAELVDQARMIKELEGRLVAMQAQLLQFNQLGKAIDQLKGEVVQMIAGADERRQQDAREAERVRAIERDNVSRAVNEIRRDLQRLPRFQEEIDLRKAEQVRLGEVILNLQQSVNSLVQDLDNKVRGIPFLEEGRHQDTKRIALLQQESIEAMKRLEQIGSRVQMIEDTTHRQERDMGEVKEVIGQMRAAQREFVEKQLLEAEHMKRQMAEWAEEMEMQVKKVDDLAGRVQEFTEQFREDRQVVANVERFHEAIRREQTQVAELQRLGEERQKRQLEQWVEENEKRWRKELLRWDHQWGEQGKRNAQVGERFIAVEERLRQHRLDIDAAWKFLESQITFESQESRRWLGEMTRLLEERPKQE
ncbi:MAG: hypothetical protein JXA93_21010 [Anaerolineae bacterium]|nr:hypothetical protein [Anaerolineae bacterium]